MDFIVHHDFMMAHSKSYRVPFDLGAVEDLDIRERFYAMVRATPTPASYTLHRQTFWWLDHGKATYVLPWHIQEAFSMTNLDGIKGKDVQSPFDTIFISFPECEWTLKSMCLTGTEQVRKVHGAYFTIDANKIWLSVVSLGDLDRWVDGDDSCFYMTCSRDQIDKGMESYFRNMDQLNEASDFWASDDTGDQKAHNVKVGLKVMRVCINMILYLRTRNAKTSRFDPVKTRIDLAKKARGRNKKEASRARKKLRGLTKDSVIMVGTTPSGKAPVQRKAIGNDQGPTKRPKCHWRVGHWRWAPYGPIQDEKGKRIAMRPTRLVWIEPVLINEDVGKPGNRTYHIKPDVDPRGQVIV